MTEWWPMLALFGAWMLFAWAIDVAAQGMPREARRREGVSGPSGLASPVRDSECAQTQSPNLSQGDTP
jgi:hypothetical protein